MKCAELEQAVEDFANARGLPKPRAIVNFRTTLPQNEEGMTEGAVYYDKTIGVGGSGVQEPLFIYEGVELGEALVLPGETRHPRRVTKREANLLARKREKVAQICNGRTGITNWAACGLGSISVPLVEREDDSDLKTATLRFAYAQYDIGRVAPFGLIDFTGLKDRLFLRRLRGTTVTEIQERASNGVINLNLRGPFKSPVLGARISLEVERNPNGTVKKTYVSEVLERLMNAGEIMMKYIKALHAENSEYFR
jgi:hypothetical protein